MTSEITCLPWDQFEFKEVSGDPLFFYVGAGLSRSSGLVGWNEMTKVVSDYRIKIEGNLSDLAPCKDNAKKNATYLQNFIEEIDPEGRRILSYDSKSEFKFHRTIILNLLLRNKINKQGKIQKLKKRDLDLHSKVWLTQCQGIFTTNYDMLLEEAYSFRRPSGRQKLYGHSSFVRTYRYNAQFLDFLLSVPRFVLKLHGDINDLGTMLFDPKSAWRCEHQLGGKYGISLCKIFNDALNSGHMIYIGCGARDKTFQKLHSWKGRNQEGEFSHLFFVPKSEVKAIIKNLGDNISDVTFLTFDNTNKINDSQFASNQLNKFLSTLVKISKSRPKIKSKEAIKILKSIKLN